MKKLHKFGTASITTHDWNANGSSLALSFNNKDVEIFSCPTKNQDWESVCYLSQHDSMVTDIAWAPRTNRIVTCSADRNAYVWVPDPKAEGGWRHTLVLLRINRAATCVVWSPDENKFAVGSGSCIVCICFFDSANDWWMAKHIRKPIRSTVTTLDWHPNNVLLAVGSTDFKVRVFSAYVKEIEDKPLSTPWGAKMPFNQLMAEFSNSIHAGGWIHCVSFSGDGNRVAWVGHDSSISVADTSKGMSVFKLKTSFLPFLSCIWISRDTIVAAGHDCTPFLYHVEPSGQIRFKGKLEDEATVNQESNSKFSAKEMFQSRDDKGLPDLVVTVLNTAHQNQISSIRIVDGDKINARQISTTAGDGSLVIWDVSSVTYEGVNGLRL